MKRMTLFVAAGLLIGLGGCDEHTPAPTGKAGATGVKEAALRYTQADAELSEIELRTSDRLYYRKGDASPFTGTAIELRLEGTRSKETTFVDGQLRGPAMAWYVNGDLFSLTLHEHNRIRYMREYGPAASDAQAVGTIAQTAVKDDVWNGAAAKDEASAPAQAQQPINAMLAAMAKGDGISESEAKSVALEVCKRLWGSDPLLKVTECKLDDRQNTWIVVLLADNGLDGWGCRVWINKTGHLEKSEFLEGG